LAKVQLSKSLVWQTSSLGKVHFGKSPDQEKAGSAKSPLQKKAGWANVQFGSLTIFGCCSKLARGSQVQLHSPARCSEASACSLAAHRLPLLLLRPPLPPAAHPSSSSAPSASSSCSCWTPRHRQCRMAGCSKVVTGGGHLLHRAAASSRCTICRVAQPVLPASRPAALSTTHG